MYRSIWILALTTTILTLRLHVHSHEETTHLYPYSHYETPPSDPAPTCRWGDKDIENGRHLTLSLSEIYSLGRLPGQCNPKQISDGEKVAFLRNRELVKEKIQEAKKELLGSEDEKRREAGRKLEEYEKSYDECVRVLREHEAKVEGKEVVSEVAPVVVGAVPEREPKKGSEDEQKLEEKIKEEKMVKERQQQERLDKERAPEKSPEQAQKLSAQNSRLAIEKSLLSKTAIEAAQNQRLLKQKQLEETRKQQSLLQQQRLQRQKLQNQRVQKQQLEQQKISRERLQLQQVARKKALQERIKENQERHRVALQKEQQEADARHREQQLRLKAIEEEEEKQSLLRIANRKEREVLQQRIMALERLEEERQEQRFKAEKIREARLREAHRAEVAMRLARQERRNQEFLRLIQAQKEEQARLLREQASQLRDEEKVVPVEVKEVRAVPVVVGGNNKVVEKVEKIEENKANSVDNNAEGEKSNVVEDGKEGVKESKDQVVAAVVSQAPIVETAPPAPTSPASSASSEKPAAPETSVTPVPVPTSETPTPAVAPTPIPVTTPIPAPTPTPAPAHLTNPLSKNLLLDSPSQIINQYPHNLTSSQLKPLFCPLSTPYFNGSTCITCPSYFNLNTRQCQSCPQNTLYDSLKLRCLPTIFTSNLNADNINIDISEGTIEEWRVFEDMLRRAGGGNVVECGLDKPFVIEGKCGVCPGETPLFDLMAGKCLKCLDGFEYDKGKRRCVVKGSK